MSRAIFLTGTPGSGKTTLLQRVVAQMNQPCGGFFTQEIRSGGERLGFEIVTLRGERQTLSHVSIQGPLHVGKYGVNLEAMETVGIAALFSAWEAGELVVIDEIGPMEILSEPFCRLVTQILDSRARVFGTIVQRSTPFTDLIKNRADVTLLEVTAQNRDQVEKEVLRMLEHN